MVRAQRQSAVEMGQRVVVPVLFGQRHGEVVVRAGVIRPLLQRAGDEPAALRLLPLLAFADAEQMQGIEMGRDGREDLPVERLRGGQIAAVLPGDGRSKLGGNRLGRHTMRILL